MVSLSELMRQFTELFFSFPQKDNTKEITISIVTYHIFIVTSIAFQIWNFVQIVP